jgi:gamma-tubulin complex component 2
MQQNTSRQSTTLRQSLNSSSGSTAAPKKISSNSTFPTCESLNPISTGTFVFSGDILLPYQKVPKNISGLPPSEQERSIIENLLYTLVGINSNLITPKLKSVNCSDYTMMNNWNDSRRANVEFDIDEQVSDSMKDILKDMLPLANYYCQLRCFIAGAEKRKSGQVLQALSEACDNIIDDYMATIAQLEDMHLKRELNLHKMLYFLRPIIQLIETVINICIKLQDQNIRGGNVLTMLHDTIGLYSGDKNSQKIIIHLIQKAAVPYMEMLSLWIFKGIVHDPRNEFFVEDHDKDLKNENYWNDYWEKRFVLQAEKIPRFLEKQADIILRTGKYLNVIRECSMKNNGNYLDTYLIFNYFT